MSGADNATHICVAMAEEEDPVVHEMDVFLSKSLATNLYVLQYPLRPGHMTYDKVDHLATRVKPNKKMVEVELGLNTRSNSYSKSKGARFAQDVDGRNQLAGDKTYFTSGIMDKQLLRSQPCAVDTDKYAIGVFRNDELHLTPVHAMVQMRPTFDYLNKADAQKAAGGDTSQDEDEEVQAVSVTARFARPESIEAKARREASYEHYLKNLRDEPWCELDYVSDEMSKQSEQQLMYGTHREADEHQQFHSTATQYLDTLLPRPDTDEQFKAPIMDNIFSRQKLKSMPLADAVRALLLNVKVIQYSKLMELLPEGTDHQVALRLLQQVAVMVQGCWVVKSDLLYPKGSCSPHSGVSCEHLIQGRDYIMWKFTHSKYVQRKEIVPRLPSEDIKDILEQMSRLRPSKGWEFVFDYDRDFVDRHPDVVQRQRFLWQAKFESLSKHLKNLPKDADKKAKEQEQMLMKQNEDHHPRRRRASSKSSPRKRTLSGRSMSDVSDLDMDVDGSGDRHHHDDALSNSTEPMEVCEDGPASHGVSGISHHEGLNGKMPSTDNGHDNKQLRTELESFARAVLAKYNIVRLGEVKKEYTLKLAELPNGHVLTSSVSDLRLMEALSAVGGVHINKQLFQRNQVPEPVFVYVHQGNRFDKVREVLCSTLDATGKAKSAAFIANVREACGDTYTEKELKKLMKDYCESRGNLWYFKGTAQSS